MAKQVLVYLGGAERSLPDYGAEWDIVKDDEEFNTEGLSPLFILKITRQCDRLIWCQCYRTMAELAQLCDGREQQMRIRGLKLAEIRPVRSSESS